MNRDAAQSYGEMLNLSGFRLYDLGDLNYPVNGYLLDHLLLHHPLNRYLYHHHLLHHPLDFDSLYHCLGPAARQGGDHHQPYSQCYKR